jgi:hypothetical protein
MGFNLAFKRLMNVTTSIHFAKKKEEEGGGAGSNLLI